MINKIITPRRISVGWICFVLFGVLCLPADQPVKENSAGPVDSVFEARKGAHKVRLLIRTRLFQSKAHKIERRGGINLIDGKMGLGTDGGLPNIEIENIGLVFDGKTMVIPPHIYRDVFEPNLSEGYFAVRFGDDLASLFVFMSGSDAAGSYNLLWVFRRDGHHSRFSLPCSDCGFINFSNGGLNGVTEKK